MPACTGSAASGPLEEAPGGREPLVGRGVDVAGELQPRDHRRHRRLGAQARAARRSTRRTAARGAARSSPAATRGRNDRSTWRYNSERTFERQAVPPRRNAAVRPVAGLRRSRNHRHAGRRRPDHRGRHRPRRRRSGRPRAAARHRVEHAGQSRRVDSAGDPGTDRDHQRDGARRAAVRADRRRGRRAHRRRRVRRPQRALRLRLPQARVRAPRPRRSPRACCAPCACRDACFRTPTGTTSTA